MWLILLKSTMDRFLGVDPLEQSVPPCVRYGTTCLLIRDALGGVSCSVMWEGCRDYLRVARCKKGHGNATTPGKLSNTRVP
jgi:hypothetical protein